MKPLSPNTLLQNRYLIVHLIGKGGMGEVYLAVDQRLGSAVALKRTFFSDDETLGNAFEREARILARLRHPVLPKVSDHFLEDETQYLVMDHISGEDLSKRLEAGGQAFPLSWGLFWADQLLEALTYLHTHEPPIIHRDIKPQNLKLTDENHIVLLDFGLSKNNAGETRVTSAGSIVGYTPHYAPMEQIRGTGTDARSDVYSLSATLYQILTNTVPPDALTRAESIVSGLPDPITPIYEINPEVSPTISDVILKGMAVAQDQRYKTARLMQKALRDAFSKLQNEVKANTLAFSAKELEAASNGTSKKEKPAQVVPVKQKETLHPAAPRSATADLPPAPVVLQNFAPVTPIEPEPQMPVNRQADIRTEVLLPKSSSPDDSFESQNYSSNEPANTVPPIFTTNEPAENENNFTDSVNFSALDFGGKQNPAADNFGAEGNFAPDSTVPLIEFDSQAKRTIENDNYAAAPETSGTATYNIAAETDDYESNQTNQTAAAKPKSRAALIGTIAAAFLVLIIGGATLGWYALSGGDTKKTSEDLPPTTPAASDSTMVEPSPAPSLEALTNSGEANTGETNSSNVNGAANVETTTTTVTPNVPKSNPTGSQQQPPRPPVIGKNPPVNPPKNPTEKPPPPKPKPGITPFQ